MIDGQRLTARRTGVGRCLESLLAEWAESGWPADEVVLVARDPGGLARVPDSPGLRTIVIGQRWPGLIWETLGLGRILRAGDVLLAPANLVPWTWRGPTVAILYDTLPWSLPGTFPWHVRLRFDWRYRLAARRATAIVVPSEATADDVRRVHGVDPARISVVYPAPEPWFRPASADAIQQSRSALGIADAPYYLFVGKRSARRNVPAILDAFAHHRRRFPDHRLVFVGPGGGTTLPTREAGVVDAGHVPEETLVALLGGARALLYPSDYEGFGLPVVEAQACGCPVVTLSNSALKESAGTGALFLGSPTPGVIADALATLADDGPARDWLVAEGRRNVERFSRRAFADGVADALRRVAAGA